MAFEQFVDVFPKRQSPIELDANLAGFFLEIVGDRHLIVALIEFVSTRREELSGLVKFFCVLVRRLFTHETFLALGQPLRGRA